MTKQFGLIGKLNFKKSAIVYVVFSIILLLVCIAIAANLLKNEIHLAVNYEKIHEKVEKTGINDDLKSELNRLAVSSDNVNNVLIVDKNDNIVYRANNNIVGNSSKFQLVPYQPYRRFFQETSNTNVIYKAVKADLFGLSEDYIKRLQISRNFSASDDDISYITDITSKELYSLNYVIDRNSGSKIFFIRSIKPVPYAENMLEAIGFILMLIFAVYWIGLALWVYKDAGKKQTNAALWGLLVLLTNLAGLLIYIMVKQSNRICPECEAMQSRDNIYCVKCGSKLNNICGKCSSMVSSGDDYCKICGNKLD